MEWITRMDMELEWISGGYEYFFVKSFGVEWIMRWRYQNVCRLPTALILSLQYEIMAYLYSIKSQFFKVDVGISVETGNFLPKNGYGWIWRIFYRKIRIWMEMDPAERGGVERVSELCPVKGSTRRPTSRVGGRLNAPPPPPHLTRLLGNVEKKMKQR